MSINITSTSDRLAADSPTTSCSTQEEGAQKYDGLSAPLAAIPDPAVIAKLANEFFAALPGKPAPSDAVSSATPNQVDWGAIPGTGAPAAVPDYPRETFSLPAMPSPRLVPESPLTEADFRAIAASLAGATALAPTAPPPAMPGASSPVVDGEKRSPWAAAPEFPAGGMFSFPGVPAMPSSPPTAPPSGSDLAAAPSSPEALTAVVPGGPIPPTTYQTPPSPGDGSRTDPWAAAPNFPDEVFSFPRVPGVSVPGAPEPAVSQPSVPRGSASFGVPPSADAPQSTHGTASSVQSPGIPGNTDSADAGRAVDTKSAPKFPSVLEMFSFPGVPGVQSPPGVPVLPSSVPTKLPSEPALAGASTRTARVPGVPQPAVPGTPGSTSSADGTAQKSAALPKDVESFEFRPDLSPGELGVAKRPLDPRLIRQDFPILQERVHGRQLIWLHNAATLGFQNRPLHSPRTRGKNNLRPQGQ